MVDRSARACRVVRRNACWSFVGIGLPAICALVTIMLVAASTAADMGPLTPHSQNPRYFRDGDGQAVYLTGSHTWDNLQDHWSPTYPVTFDFDAYLDFLEAYNHNYIRLWRSEMPEYRYNGADAITTTWPHPWARTGPGTAGDGEPKFNLNTFDNAYFNRLRQRCLAAQERGIYVCIMLFEGHALQFTAQGWHSHPFKLSNNVNGINGDPNNDGRGVETHTLGHDGILNYQKAYIRKVIDTVNDLDNVLYEISNESHADSLDWQRHLINYIQSYQASKPQQHPVVLSTPFPNAQGGAIWNSNADAVAPGNADGPYGDIPPPANGDKVIIVDSDHLFGCGGHADWVWKSFARGLNPIYMDSYYPDGHGCSPPIEGMRVAMGATRTLAQRVNMANMTPHGNLASSGYCLANVGQDYLVFLPGGTSVSVNLSGSSNSFSVEWVHAQSGHMTAAPSASGGAWRNFTAPAWGSWGLVLTNNGGGGGGGGGDGGGGGGDDGGGSGDNDGGGFGNPPAPWGGDQYGRSVALAGDVNGDGFNDLIAGAPYTDANGNSNAGRAYLQVYSPSEDRYVIYFTFNGEHAGDRFGWAVATAGDVNADGFDDIIIGAPWNDQAGGNAGKAYVYSGRDGGLLATHIGEEAGDLFGYSAAGDLRVSGDARDDYIIGAPYNDGHADNAGKVYVYAGGSYVRIDAVAGQHAGDRFGHALARVGRTNDDAYDEFVVGAPDNDQVGSNAGKVYLYNGRTRGVIFSRTGARAGDRLGWAVAGVGRSNDDQWDDFAVSSPYYDASGGNNVGRVRLLSGRNGAVLWTRSGQAAGDLFGYAIGAAGDVNGSGSGDVIIGAPNHDAGGLNAGRVYVYSGGNGTRLHLFNGHQPGERFGWSVAAVGDVNSDLFIEVTVGASQHSNSTGQNAGAVYLLTTPQ